ncbi:MAG: TetR family transcriptional regulator [Jatrophihabitans sp.]|nr:MAG: TetR family transcriptional regulator [Jatrophihabitans sp.]
MVAASPVPRPFPDPLDVLIRSTAPAASGSVASAAPVRAPGTRSRAGNAMHRTRAALLDGARRSVATSGTKITMSQVAASGGVAKATLYNHLRTREAVLTALLEDEVATVCHVLASRPLADALAALARSLSDHPVLRGLARVEPAALARLGRVDPSVAQWRAARAAVDAALGRAGHSGTDTVLRWLASFVISPAEDAVIADDLAVLLTGLPQVPAAASDAGTRTA